MISSISSFLPTCWYVFIVPLTVAIVFYLFIKTSSASSIEPDCESRFIAFLLFWFAGFVVALPPIKVFFGDEAIFFFVTFFAWSNWLALWRIVIKRWSIISANSSASTPWVLAYWPICSYRSFDQLGIVAFKVCSASAAWAFRSTSRCCSFLALFSATWLFKNCWYLIAWSNSPYAFCNRQAFVAPSAASPFPSYVNND